eukprot:2217247-Prymnesium_polylepis.1
MCAVFGECPRCVERLSCAISPAHSDFTHHHTPHTPPHHRHHTHAHTRAHGGGRRGLPRGGGVRRWQRAGESRTS